MKRTVAVFLQNAWSPVYSGKTWPRQKWLKALSRSRSGKRLTIMTTGIGDTYSFWFDNTTTEVSSTPKGRCSPNPAHIRDVLDKAEPSVVVCCGSQAINTVPNIWKGPTLLVPHPAHRLVTNELYYTAARILADGFGGTIKILQKPRGEVFIDDSFGQLNEHQ